MLAAQGTAEMGGMKSIILCLIPPRPRQLKLEARRSCLEQRLLCSKQQTFKCSLALLCIVYQLCKSLLKYATSSCYASLICSAEEIALECLVVSVVHEVYECGPKKNNYLIFTIFKSKSALEVFFFLLASLILV